MKRMNIVLGLAGMMAAAVPSRALVAQVAKCSNEDYSVTIVDNEGLGSPREAHYSATVSLTVNLAPGQAPNPGMGRPVASFALDKEGSEFVDSKTSGEDFKFFQSANGTAFFEMRLGDTKVAQDLDCEASQQQ